MNDQEFKPIIKKQAPEPEAAKQPPVDPATRIVQEMSLTNTLLKGLVSRIEALENRAAPVTADQVKAIIEALIKSGAFYEINSDEIVQSLIPHLAKQGTKTAISVQDIIQEANNQMSFIYEREAKKWNARIGFTSPKAALIILGSCFLVSLSAVWYASKQTAQVQTAQQTVIEANKKLNFYSEYDKWIDKQYPRIWPEYEKVLRGGSKRQKK